LQYEAFQHVEATKTQQLRGTDYECFIQQLMEVTKHCIRCFFFSLH